MKKKKITCEEKTSNGAENVMETTAKMTRKLLFVLFITYVKTRRGNIIQITNISCNFFFKQNIDWEVSSTDTFQYGTE